MHSIIVPIMGAHFFYLSHVLGLGVACDALEDKGKTCPNHKCYRKDVILVEG